MHTLPCGHQLPELASLQLGVAQCAGLMCASSPLENAPVSSVHRIKVQHNYGHMAFCCLIHAEGLLRLHVDK